MSELHISPSSYAAITDNELDDMVSEITAALPHCGQYLVDLKAKECVYSGNE